MHRNDFITFLPLLTLSRGKSADQDGLLLARIQIKVKKSSSLMAHMD